MDGPCRDRPREVNGCLVSTATGRAVLGEAAAWPLQFRAQLHPLLSGELPKGCISRDPHNGLKVLDGPSRVALALVDHGEPVVRPRVLRIDLRRLGQIIVIVLEKAAYAGVVF